MSIIALQTTAVAVATVLDDSMAIAMVTGHAAPQCERLGNPLPESIAAPLLVFQTANARRRGGLLGSFRVDVEVYAFALSMPEASTLLATAFDALSPLAFAAVGLDAVPAFDAPTSADPLEADDVPFPEAFGVATTVSLDVFIPPT